ncbi:MAG TPA: hypothetical protein VFR15_01650 [Chloroflexia bacterium]|nr:hypothetical protein [Chloroflexia bacterium]
MGNEIWRSKEREIVSRYADRLAGIPADLPRNEPQPERPASSSAAIPPAAQAAADPQKREDEVTLNYAHGVLPPRDLLNYKNMELEMAIWARTGVGWMSVIVLAIMTASCFILSTFLNLIPW